MRTTQLAVIMAEKMCRLLPDTRRCRGRVTQFELVEIQRTHGPLTELPTATKRMSSLPNVIVRAASSPILCS